MAIPRPSRARMDPVLTSSPNNYLDGAGQTVLFGGADPFIVDLVPSDITLPEEPFLPAAVVERRRNFVVKTLLELRNAQRVHD